MQKLKEWQENQHQMLNKIQNWILKQNFVTHHYAQYERAASIDAFKKAREDLEETNVYDVDTKAEALAKQKLNDLLSPVDLTKIVSLDKNKGIIFIGGEKIEDGRLANLKSEAEFLLQSDIWKLLCESPKELAQRAMFVAGETLSDLQKGKSILYTLSTQQNILQLFKGYIAKPSIKKP